MKTFILDLRVNLLSFLKRREKIVTLFFSVVFVLNTLQFFQIKKNYLSIDLINRIVGSNLLNDGCSPYFYKWTDKEDVRYLDPYDFPDLPVSRVTVTPFTLQLFSPLNKLSLKDVNSGWVIVQAFSIIGIWALFYFTSKKKLERVLISGICFVLIGISSFNNLSYLNGQMYSIYSMLLSIIFFLSIKGKHFILIAFFISFFLLLRPVSLLLLPLYTIKKEYKILIAVFVFIIIYFFVCFNYDLLTPWTDYLKMLTYRSHNFDILYREEAYYQVYNLNQIFGLRIHEGNLNFIGTALSEQTSLAYIFKDRLHFNVSMKCISEVFLSLCLLFFLLVRRKIESFDLWESFLLFTVLYFASEISQPAYRHSYYSTQLIFPTLLVMRYYSNRKYKREICLVLVGLLLTFGWFANPKIIEQTVGEALIYVVISFILFIKYNKDRKSTLFSSHSFITPN